MGELMPKYYLRHETPAGRRYAYPLPELPKDITWRNADHKWRGFDYDGAEASVHVTPGQSYPSVQGWVISDAILVTLVAEWTESGGLGSWQKQSRPEEDIVVQSVWACSAEEPDAETLRHLDDADGHYIDDCSSCLLLRQVYARQPLPRVARSEEYQLGDWVFLADAGIDSAPKAAWTVADPSQLAVYGRHTAHLWPGSMSGFRTAVVAALKAHPIGPDNVYDHDRNGNVSVFWTVYWDRPIPRKRAPDERRRKSGYETRVALRQHAEHIVPDAIAAPTKAEALAAWDRKVAEWVGKFLPDMDRATACSHCHGRGFIPGTTS